MDCLSPYNNADLNSVFEEVAIKIAKNWHRWSLVLSCTVSGIERLIG